MNTDQTAGLTGDDNVLIGDVAGEVGSRNVIIRPGRGDDLRIGGGTAIGFGAHADPTSVAIGTFAIAGTTAACEAEIDKFIADLVESDGITAKAKEDARCKAEELKDELRSPRPRRHVVDPLLTALNAAAALATVTGVHIPMPH